jgi:hypothetical protein
MPSCAVPTSVLHTWKLYHLVLWPLPCTLLPTSHIINSIPLDTPHPPCPCTCTCRKGLPTLTNGMHDQVKTRVSSLKVTCSKSSKTHLIWKPWLLGINDEREKVIICIPHPSPSPLPRHSFLHTQPISERMNIKWQWHYLLHFNNTSTFYTFLSGQKKKKLSLISSRMWFSLHIL